MPRNNSMHDAQIGPITSFANVIEIANVVVEHLKKAYPNEVAITFADYEKKWRGVLRFTSVKDESVVHKIISSGCVTNNDFIYISRTSKTYAQKWGILVPLTRAVAGGKKGIIQDPANLSDSKKEEKKIVI
uniref:LUD_dom domain-containing protein n=1 Tax=Rhabditophanes sp. KR3021 TaxID=114890 RepID=A0AC35TM29_9BILA